MKNKVYPNILQSLGIIGIFFMFSVLFFPFNPSFHIFRLDAELLMLIYYLLSMGTTFILVYFIKKKLSGNIKINFSVDNRGCYFMLMAATVLLLFITGTIANLIPMSNNISKALAGIVRQTGIFTFIYFVILAPVFEELLFRGIMLDGMLNRYSPIKAIIWSSIFFGVAHLNPWQFITAFSIGCFSGWVYYRSKSVLPCIVIHIAANATGFVIRLLSNPDQLSGMKSFSSGDTAQWWILIALALGLFVILIYLLNEFLPSPKNSPA